MRNYSELLAVLDFWQKTNSLLKVVFVSGEEDTITLKRFSHINGQVTLEFFSQKKEKVISEEVSSFQSINNQPLSFFNIPEQTSITEESLLNKANNEPYEKWDLLYDNNFKENKFIFTVSSLTDEIKKTLTDKFQRIWVKGEISEATVSFSGHMFLSLKDEDATLNLVIFKSQLKKMRFQPEVGLKVECFGSISLYEKRGSYQLIVEKMLPEGQGELDLAFKQLYEKLKQKGLFDLATKKSIPTYPEKVAIITSPRGAALQDILRTIDLEYPELEIFIFPVTVQGDKAHEEIATMIEYVNRLHLGLDLIILTRGGGSKEDLWCFNQEKLAYAIYNSSLPIITAIGHEVDYTIADLVGDYRVATPTAAAEKISREKKELIYQLNEKISSWVFLMGNKLTQLKERLNFFSKKIFLNQFQFTINNQKKESLHLEKSLFSLMKNQLKSKGLYLSVLREKIIAASPQEILKKGYYLIKKEEKIISDITKINSGEMISLENHQSKRKAKLL